jgi:hypothetical protein
VTRFRPLVGVLEDRRLLSADVLTYHNDNARSGVDSSETILSPANVNVSTFGKVGFDAVDGKVDAQPLYVAGVSIPGQGTHNVLYVATEHDSVYAFDADTGAELWQVSMLGPGEVPSDPHGGTITPQVGITATPVIDPNTDTMYVVAMSKLVSGNTTTYIQRIHAMDITTGADKVAPKSIDQSITYPGAGPGGNGTDVIFDPMQYDERDALLLVNGVVYTGWASHGDHPPYTGWLIGFNANDLSLASVLNIDPNGAPTSPFLGDGSGNTFWNSGGGPAADAAGNIYNTSGNGPFDPNLNAAGFPANGDYGDSFLKFTPTPGGLTVSDYFTPYNQQQLADTDKDIGSSGPMLVDVTDSLGTPHQLLFGGDKSGNIYVVDTSNMGKFNPTSNNIYQELPGAAGSGEYGSLAAFNGQVYIGGVGAKLSAFQFVNGQLQPTPASQSSNTFGYPGTTPSISSEGNANGIVWALNDSASGSGGPAVLYAYDASNLSNMLYNSNQAPNGRDSVGPATRFMTPTIANGKVYVATADGVAIFGLLPPIADAGFEQPYAGPAGAYGSFLYDPTGTAWTYAGMAGVSANGSGFTAGNPNAPEGGQVGFLQGAGAFSQAVAGWAAGTYQISFAAAQRANVQASRQDFQVLVDGAVVGTFTPAGTAYASYTTAAFTVTAGLHTIAFQGLDSAGGDNTAFLDNVQVAQAVSAPAVSDAGFESPAVGSGNFQYAPSGTPWAFTGGGGISGNGSGFTAGNPNAPEGGQVGFLQGNGSFSQTVSGWAAGSYTISFEAAQRGNFQASRQDFEVLVDGNVVGTFTPSGTSYQGYTTGVFTVAAGMHTIAFQGLDSAGGDNTAFIDQVIVT